MLRPCSLYESVIWDHPYVPRFVYYYRRTLPPRHHMKCHRHHQIEMIYVESGRLRIQIVDDVLSLKEKEFLIVDGGVPHARLPMQQESRLIACEFFFEHNPDGFLTTKQVAEQLGEQLWFTSACRCSFVRGVDHGSVKDAFKDLIFTLNMGPAAETLTQLNFWRVLLEMGQIIANMKTPRSTTNLHVNRAINYIKQNYHRELSIDEISEHLGLNRSYFSRIFKEATGHSPWEYVTKVRLQHAKKLLVTTTSSILDICHDVGIPNEQNFSRVFKKYEGVSPSVFRQNCGDGHLVMTTTDTDKDWDGYNMVCNLPLASDGTWHYRISIKKTLVTTEPGVAFESWISPNSHVLNTWWNDSGPAFFVGLYPIASDTSSTSVALVINLKRTTDQAASGGDSVLIGALSNWPKTITYTFDRESFTLRFAGARCSVQTKQPDIQVSDDVINGPHRLDISRWPTEPYMHFGPLNHGKGRGSIILDEVLTPED